MKIRPATLDDSLILLTWRNDPETRQQSIHKEEILLESHIKWLAATLKMESRKLYLAEDQGVLIGSVRSDKNPDGTVELSWTIAPKERGKGYGETMVLLFAKEIHSGEKLMAFIRKGNLASEKIARALGLHPLESKFSNQLDEPPIIIWRSMNLFH